MKQLLLILLFLPMIGFGQMFGSISSLTISPLNPNNTDTVYVYAELLFASSGCPLDMKNSERFFKSLNKVTKSSSSVICDPM